MAIDFIRGSVARSLAIVTVSVVMSLSVGSLEAAEWRLAPGVSANYSYSDNINLDDSAVETAQIIELSPSIGIQAKGASLSYIFNYSPLFHYRESDQGATHNVQHPLNSTLSLDLLKDRLLIDSGASITRYYSDASKGLVSDQQAIRSDYSEAQRVHLSPTLKLKLGEKLDFESSYKVDGLRQKGADKGHSLGKRLSLALRRDRHQQKIGWGLSHQRNEVEFNSNSADQTSSTGTNGYVNYQLNTRLRLSADVGQETFSDRAATNRQDTSNGYYGAGLNWLPSKHTVIELNCRQFEYGNSCSTNSNYRSKSFLLGAMVNESRIQARDVNLSDQMVDCGAGEDCSSIAAAGLPLTEGLIDNQNINLYGNMNSGRLTITGQLSRTKKNYVASSTIERLYQGSAGVTYQSGQRATMAAHLTKQHNSIKAGVVETQTLELSYQYQLGEKVVLNGMLRETENETLIAQGSYQEQRVTFGVTASF